MSDKTKHLYLVDEIPNDDELRATEKPYVFVTNDGKVQYHWRFKQPMDYVEVAGVKWMKCNLGASTETEYGLYYPWGGTIGYKGCSVCKFSESDPLSNMLYGKYEDELKEMGAIDDNYKLTPAYDAVTQALGDGWRMPTTNEWQSLIDNTTYSWENNFNGSGANGGKFTLKNGSGDYLFIPASGIISESGVDNSGVVGHLWNSNITSETHPSSALRLYFYYVGIYNYELLYRCYGCSLRGVKTT